MEGYGVDSLLYTLNALDNKCQVHLQILIKPAWLTVTASTEG